MHGFYGTPKQGQNLEEVKDLLLSQINEVKKGNFPDWLVDAIISDLKLDKIKKMETNSGRANEFVEAFTLGVSWKDYQDELSKLTNISKQDIIMPDKLVKIDNPDKKLHCLDSRYGELGFSFPSLILAVSNPNLLFYPYQVWMKIGHFLGWINSRIILGLVFILILQPIALIMRIFGYDPLRQKKDNSKSFREIKENQKSNFTRIF